MVNGHLIKYVIPGQRFDRETHPSQPPKMAAGERFTVFNPEMDPIMEGPMELTPEHVEGRLDSVETARDEDRLAVLEEVYNDLDSALAEIEGEQAGPPGR